jgi:hypothetical protein
MRKNSKKEAVHIQTRVLTLSLTSVLMIYLALSMFPASAELQLVERSTKTKGATTITWDSSFQDLDYTKGDPISIEVTWTVNAGAAEYESLSFKKATPRSKKDPALVDLIDVAYDGGTMVAVTFRFTELHWDAERLVDMGNAHFKLYLIVDEDGDGAVDLLTGYGVNVHVEDPL